MEVWKSAGPIRGVHDIQALESIPLAHRFASWDVNRWIRNGCLLDPDKTALTFFTAGDPAENPSLTSYRDLFARITQTANLLHARGIRSNDAVIFILPTLPDTYVTLLAAMARGIVCSVNWMLNPDHIAALVRKARAKAVIALGPTPGFDIWEKLQSIRGALPEGAQLFSVPGPGGEILPESDLASEAANHPGDRLIFEDERGRDDLVAYVHSGGTTGVPKLVRLTSGGFVHKCWTVTMTMAHATDDVLISDMPMFHIAGLLSCGVLPVILGSSIVIPSPLGARDKVFVKNYWKFIERMRVTFLHCVPATLSVLASNPPQGEDVGSLRDYSVTGSTALPVDVARKLEQATGIRLVATYGATEFTQNVTQAPRNGDPRYGSAGIRNPDTEIRIVHLDSAGAIVRDCRANEIGCVLVRSPGNTPGYVDGPNDPSVLRPDEWINNGDLGRLDEDGYLWITGRAKDLIIRSGHNIDPAIIEEALYKSPAVFMAAAVGKPDRYAGELPVAYVQLVAGATATEDNLKAVARTHISDPAAVPREIQIVEEMPLTDVRKIAKPALRRWAAQRVFEAELRKALPDGVPFSVQVVADDTEGSVAEIKLSGAATPAIKDIDAQIADVLQGYAMRHRVIRT